MKTQVNKYKYEVVLQQYVSNQWNDIEFFDTDSTFYLPIKERERLQQNIMDYKRNLPSYSYRTIRRRTLINQNK